MSANGLRPYPAYRDSGVEWLGRVPEHWEVRRLGATTERLVAGTWGSDPTGHDDIVCVRVADFDRRRLGVNLRKPTLRSVPVGERQRRLLEPGDLLLEKSGGGDLQPVGVVVHFDHGQEAVASNFIGRMRVRRQHSARYVLYLNSVLYAIRLTVRSIKQTTGIQNLDVGAYLSESVPLPSLSEQTSIARFLEAADRRIRRYIRAKERLVELLEERKRALIHEAVTGRIDVRTGQPYPAYKDSGAAWLPAIPNHWEVRRLANIADLRVSNVDKHVREEEEPIRLCNYVDVYHNDRIGENIAFMPATARKAEIERFRMAVGDVLLTKDSEDWTDIGVPALVEYAAPDLVCGYHLAMLRPNDAFLDAGYLFRALADSRVARQFRVAANGVTRYGLSRHAIQSVRIPLPPVVAQGAIVCFLDRADRCIRRHISVARRQIDLLREYRTRLIADVVTGKLDVREAATRLPETDPLAGDRDRTDTIPTESSLHSTANEIAKEANA